jgi:sugar (pentulose or hexulose) kinase
MENRALTISIDCGTQSIRAMLFNEKGKVINKSKSVFSEPYFSIKPGWAEQDPFVWHNNMIKVIKDITKDVDNKTKEKIKSISITTMRDTFICLDKDNNVLRPSILWLDQRESGVTDKLPIVSRFLFKVSSMNEAVDTNRQSASCNWIMKNEKDIWEKTEHYVSISSFLILQLTGHIVDSIGNQCGHIPYDYKRNKYQDKSNYKYCIFPVEKEKLSTLVESGTELKPIKEELLRDLNLPKNIKLIASGTDKGCETLGSGCINENWASLSFGTTSTVQLMLNKYVEPQQFLPAYPAIRPNFFNSELEVFRGYWMVSWYIEQFGTKERNISNDLCCPTEEIFDKTLDNIPPGCDGLMLQPYWGPGLKTPEAKGSIIGFSDYHTKYHIYRAIIEGINYALMEGLNNVSKRANCEVRYLTLNGGGAKSDRICQITADMFGLPVYRCQTTETSSLGSAICAMVGSGIYSSYEEAIENMVQHTSIFKPNEKIHEYYESLFNEVYCPLYSKLKPSYRKLRKIINDNKIGSNV